MSAFIVRTGHIDAILTFANKHRCWLPQGLKSDSTDDLSRAGFLLLCQNRRSVNQRYEENKEAPPYTFQFHPRELAPLEVISACQCYDYQSCETGDYDSTIARQIVDHIRATAIGKLPGYRATDWEVKDGRD